MRWRRIGAVTSRRARSARPGTTLVEVMVALVAFAILFVLLLHLQQIGFRNLESDSRKLTASRDTHVQAEALRLDLDTADWAWVVPLKCADTGKAPKIAASSARWILDDDRQHPGAGAAVGAVGSGADGAGAPGGATLMYVGWNLGGRGSGRGRVAREYYHDPTEKTFTVGGKIQDEKLADVRFFDAGPHLVKYAIRADEHVGNIPLPAHRERSTLVSAVFVQPQAEEARFERHAWEPEHGWCVAGPPVHSGFTDSVQ